MSFSQTIEAAVTELKTNPRLRWGVWGIAAVLWFYGTVELRDQVRLQTEAYRAVNTKLARMQRVATQTEWVSRLEDARARQLGLESKLWREGTIGLAQATFNDWLRQLTQQAGLLRVQLVVSAQDDAASPARENAAPTARAETSSMPGLWKVTAKLAFDFDPASFYPLLMKLATHDRKVHIESATIQSVPAPRTELLLVAYFQESLPSADKSVTR